MWKKKKKILHTSFPIPNVIFPRETEKKILYCPKTEFLNLAIACLTVHVPGPTSAYTCRKNK